MRDLQGVRRDDFLGLRILTPGGVGRVIAVQDPDHAGMGHWYLVAQLAHGLCFLPADEPGAVRLAEESKRQEALFEDELPQ